MPECTLESFYNSSWGILASRRADVEKSAFGGFDKILDEEIHKNFWNVDMVAYKMEVHPTTARKWLYDFDARFIFHKNNRLYSKEDAESCIEGRKQIKAAIKAKSEAKKKKSNVPTIQANS